MRTTTAECPRADHFVGVTKKVAKRNTSPLERAHITEYEWDFDAGEGLFLVEFNHIPDGIVEIEDVNVHAVLWLRLRDDVGILGERLDWESGLTLAIAGPWADHFQAEIETRPELSRMVEAKCLESLE